MAYIGNAPVIQSTEFREEFFPTSNQSAFTTGGFHPSAVSVTRNGVLLSESDYTKGSDNVTITLNSAAVSGDVVVIRGNRSLAQGVSVSESRVEYTWQSGDTVVQLNADVIPLYTDVYLNGVKLAAADYSINASTKQVSFTSAPAVGDVIAVVHKNETSALVALPLKDSSGAAILSESGSTVTLANVDTATVGSNALVVNSSGNVGIGTSPANILDVGGATRIRASAAPTWDTNTRFWSESGFGTRYDGYQHRFDVGNSRAEAMRIDTSGNLVIANTNPAVASGGSGVYGIGLRSDGSCEIARSSNPVMFLNRTTNDGEIIQFRQNGTNEGAISVSGASVTYGPFTGSHWSRLLDGSKPDIPRGTILESLDEMMDWVKEDGTLEDDIKHVKCKISDTVESKNVYGLFFAWDNDDDYNDLNVAQEGSFVIRIHSSQDVQRGDLIQSNGDGTGKIQADDIIRSSTVAKVISNHRVETYEDGSYIVPCVIHC
jgi:hypothetical protein